MVLQQNCDEIDINFKKHILTNQITYVLITVTQEALSKYLHVSVSMAFRQHFTEITIKNVWQSIERKIRLVFTVHNVLPKEGGHMGYTKKTLEELDVLDDFLMNAVADDREVGEAFCRCILSVLLQRKIGRVRIAAQYALPAAVPGQRGIRMDVEVEEYEEGDAGEVYVKGIYDIEPHLRDGLNLPRHNRFYQAKIDSRNMKVGENDFSKLPDLFIITITNYDPFGKGYMMYTVRNRCGELPDMEYGDGLQFIYFYSRGEKGGNAAIKAMLKYLEKSVTENVSDDATRELHQYISRVKQQPEVRKGYMRFEEIIASEREEAVEEAAINIYVQNIMELLEDIGTVPDELCEKLNAINNIPTLKKYQKLAARANSIDEFAEKAFHL